MELGSWLDLARSTEISSASRMLFQDSGSGRTGVDPTLFWAIVSALASTVATLASILYRKTLKDLEDAKEELREYRRIAPTLADDVRWLVEEKQSEMDRQAPWPLERDPPSPPPRRPTSRRGRRS
jgi:hypothetical protein